MTADLVAAESGTTLAAARSAIAAAQDAVEAHDVAARVQMAKAWAKAHGLYRDLRLQLLDLEVEALVRVVELNGTDLLTPAERKAGEYLAAMTRTERASLVGAHQAKTSATGMCSAIWREQEARESGEQRRQYGRQWASGEREGVAQALGAALRARETAGVPFEVADMADDVVLDIDEGDTEFMQGVREMCRKALLKSPPQEIDGTLIPKFITSNLEDGTWVRIPTPSATYEDLQRNLAVREEQLRQDVLALERFRKFVDKVAAYRPTPQTKLADVFATSVQAAA